MLRYYLYRIGLFIIYRLPFNFSYLFAICLCDLHYFFSFRDRRAVKNNLRTLFPQNEGINQKARQVFRNFGKYLVEFFYMKRIVDKEFFRTKVHPVGLEYIDQVLKRGKGGIILTAHLGNWELGAVLLALLGYPITAVALPHKERSVNDLFNNQRESKGIVVVSTDQAVKKCMQALRNNQLVALVGDRDFSSNGEIIEFLGKKAFIPKGAAVFAERTGAAIMPAFLTRRDDNSFDLVIERPLIPDKTRETDEKQHVILNLMTRYLETLENKIRQYPTQWLMFREFWINENKCSYPRS